MDDRPWSFCSDRPAGWSPGCARLDDAGSNGVQKIYETGHLIAEECERTVIQEDKVN